MKLTIKEAAGRLGVSSSLVYAWCRQNLLTHFRFGRPGKRGKILIDEEAVTEFAERHKQLPESRRPPIKLKHIRV